MERSSFHKYSRNYSSSSSLIIDEGQADEIEVNLQEIINHLKEGYTRDIEPIIQSINSNISPSEIKKTGATISDCFNHIIKTSILLQTKFSPSFEAHLIMAIAQGCNISEDEISNIKEHDHDNIDLFKEILKFDTKIIQALEQLLIDYKAHIMPEIKLNELFMFIIECTKTAMVITPIIIETIKPDYPADFAKKFLPHCSFLLAWAAQRTLNLITQNAPLKDEFIAQNEILIKKFITKNFESVDAVLQAARQLHEEKVELAKSLLGAIEAKQATILEIIQNDFEKSGIIPNLNFVFDPYRRS